MKKLMVKNGSYMKDGQEKAKWVQVGVIMDGQNGEFAILEPHVNLAAFPREEGRGVMCSIFDDSQQPQQNNQNQPQQPHQQSFQQQPQQQGFNQQQY